MCQFDMPKHPENEKKKKQKKRERRKIWWIKEWIKKKKNIDEDWGGFFSWPASPR